MKFPDVLGVYDYAGLVRNSRIAPNHVAFHYHDSVSIPICNFSKLDTQPACTPVYASLGTSQHPMQNSGPSGLLLLSRKALSSSTPHRFIPAHHGLLLDEAPADDLINRRFDEGR